MLKTIAHERHTFVVVPQTPDYRVNTTGRIEPETDKENNAIFGTWSIDNIPTIVDVAFLDPITVMISDNMTVAKCMSVWDVCIG